MLPLETNNSNKQNIIVILVIRTIIRIMRIILYKNTHIHTVVHDKILTLSPRPIYCDFENRNLTPSTPPKKEH